MTVLPAATIWRDKVVDGVYSSDDHNPDKPDIRAWAAWVESGITAGTLNGPWEATLSALNAKLAYGDGNPGFVYAGADFGTYRKSGASGSGSWVKILDTIPGYQFVNASDAGAGTANAIIATSAPPVSYATGSQLIRLNIFETNTSAIVTVNFNDGGALQIKTATGDNPKPGDLKAGMNVIGTVSGVNFRLVNQFGAQFLTATNVSGTNAIVATTPTTLPGDGEALIILPISITNTATPVTVAFNGGSALTIKTASGNDPVVGGLVAGTLIAGLVSGSAFRMISDQASAAIVAAVEADRILTEEARDAVLAALSSVTVPLATLALAIADDPDVDPTYYNIDYFDTTQQPGSTSNWKKTTDDVSALIAVGAAFQNANGTSYVNNSDVLRPEQFGRIGVNAAGDTAAWEALAALANYRAATTSSVLIRAHSEYLLSGTAVEFFDIENPILDLRGASLRQQTNFSRTLSFQDCGVIEIEGGKFYGRGGATGEWVDIDSLDVDWNGVAGIYARECTKLVCKSIEMKDHTGHAIFGHGTEKVFVHNCQIEGIGPDYIDAFDNGSNFGVCVQPYDNTQGWIFEVEIKDCHIWNAASGVQAVLTRRFEISGGEISGLGEHCAYGIDLDGISITNVTLSDAPLFGFKNQLENYAGTVVWPLWTDATAYAVGDKVRRYSVAWRCINAHTSTGSGMADWVTDESYYRNGGIIEGCTIRNTGVGVGSTQADAVFGLNTWINDMVIRDNLIVDSTTRGVNLERMVGAVIENNTILRSAGEGIYAVDFSGVVRGNFVDLASDRAIVVIGLDFDSFIENNIMIDCGLGGTDEDTRTPIVIAPPIDARKIPALLASPVVFFKNNGFFFRTGTSPASTHLLISSDTRVVFSEIKGTYGSTTTKTFQVDGSVTRNYDNHFAGFLNTAQNLPAYTVSNPVLDRAFDPNTATVGETASVLGTLIADLQAARLIR